MDAMTIVNAASMQDKEGFMQAFNDAIAAKMTDALDVKKVEIASNLLGTQDNVETTEVSNEVEPTEVEVSGTESSGETADVSSEAS